MFLISNQMNKGGDWGRSGVVVAGVGWWWWGGGGGVVVENVLESRGMKMKAFHSGRLLDFTASSLDPRGKALRYSDGRIGKQV